MPEQAIICIGCPLGCRVSLKLNDSGEIESMIGNQCQEGQKYIAADLDKAGVVIGLKRHTEVTPEHLAGTIFRLIDDHELRQKMSRRGRELVDGQGSARIAQKLLADYQDDMERNSLCA